MLQLKNVDKLHGLIFLSNKFLIHILTNLNKLGVFDMAVATDMEILYFQQFLSSICIIMERFFQNIYLCYF